MLARSRATRCRRLAAVAAGLLTAFALGALAQPPGGEEEVKGFDKSKIKRIAVEDDPAGEKKATDVTFGNPPDVKLDELARAVEEAKFAAIKDLYVKHLYPFDRITIKGTPVNVRPIPPFRTEPLPKLFGIQEVGAGGQIGPLTGVSNQDASKVEHFEEIALRAANDLLAQKPLGTAPSTAGWSAGDQLLAAERLLAAALRFHDYAREYPVGQTVRRGPGWDAARKPLADRLRQVRLDGLKNALAANDWDRANETGSRLMAAYPKDEGVAAEVAKARVQVADLLLRTEDARKHVSARALLDELETRYPGVGGDAVKKLRAQITDIAQRAFQRAKDREAAKDIPAAKAALSDAAALDSTLEGLREMQKRLGTGGQTLYVGVREFPRNLSPFTARSDSERQAVELLFEGLLAEVPDEFGVRYRAAAATAMPLVVPGGREFALRTQERTGNARGFDSQDVVGTVRMLQAKGETWAAYPLAWLDDLPTPLDNAGVRVGFRHGHPDPRALLTFKLLPARWMDAEKRAIDDPVFAERPYGTGPYVYQSSAKGGPDSPREMTFAENPLYARRDRANLPRIKEVRLVEVPRTETSDRSDRATVEAFERGGLHILPDVPTSKLDTFSSKLGARAQVVTAATNRRVYFLAVNHRRPQMRSKLLRQGISQAINREEVLSAVFRAGKPDFHKAMTGPFPPNSWAGRGTGSPPVPLVNRDLAFTRLKAYLGESGAKPDVTLRYPDADPLAKLACEAIQKQIDALFKDAEGKRLTVRLDPTPLPALWQAVEDEHDYDLAYLPFDYPDDWYPYALGAMLDPQAAKRGGRNWFGYLTENSGAEAADVLLGQLLGDTKTTREFKVLADKTETVRKQFNECLPFIPLWQLDRHTLVSNGLRVVADDTDATVGAKVLNPTTLFQGVARWRLE